MTALQDTVALRQKIIDACLWMEKADLNKGTAGNISVRVADGLLMTPSAVPYTEMTTESICLVDLDAPPAPDALPKPTTEWRFHQAIMQARPDVTAVVHAHPPHCTAIATQRRGIRAVHYMIAAFGGADVPLADYALYGSEDLSRHVVSALTQRHGCLMANHGAIAVGPSLDRALWRMQELENLARIDLLARAAGDPVLLSEAEIEEVLTSFQNYGRT